MRTGPTVPLALLAIALSAASAWGGEAAPEPVWQASLKAGRVLSDEQQKPLLLYFHAAWCGNCRRMDDTWADSRVRELLPTFIPVKLDVDDPDGQRAALEFNVEGVPLIVVVSPNGRILSAVQGYVGPDALAPHLRTVAAPYLRGRAEPVPIAKQNALEQLKAQDLSPDQWRQVIAALAELRNDLDLQTAIKQHRDFPAAELVDTLRSSGLAVRLAAFEILQDVSGEEFGFDPWAAPAEQPAPLGRWDAWAQNVTKSGLPKTLFAPLTEERISVLVADLIGPDEPRSRRARVLLSQSEKPGLNVIEKIAAGQADLKDTDRLKVREILFSILVPPQLARERLEIARALVYSDIEGQAGAIKRLQAAGGANALPLMARLLRDDNPLVREAAIEATRLIGNKASRDLLLEMKDEKDVNVRVTLITNLAYSSSSQAVEFVLDNLGRPEEEIVLAALRALRQTEKPSATTERLTAALQPLFKDPRWRVRSELIETVGKLSVTGMDDNIIQCLDDKDDFVRKNAVLVCGHRELTAAKAKLLALFKSDHGMKPTIAGILQEIDENAFDAELTAELMKAPEDVILATLSVMVDREALPKEMLAALLGSGRENFKTAAIQAIGELGRGYKCERLDPALLTQIAGFITKDNPEPVRLEALSALAQLDWSRYLRTEEGDSRPSRPRRGFLGILIDSDDADEPRAGTAGAGAKAALKKLVIERAGDCLKDPSQNVCFAAAMLLGRQKLLDGAEILCRKCKDPSINDESRTVIAAVLCGLLAKGEAPRLQFPDKTVLDTDDKVQAHRKELLALAEKTVSEMLDSKSPELLHQLISDVAPLQHPGLSQRILELVKEKRADLDVLFSEMMNASERRYYGPRPVGGPALSVFEAKVLEFARSEIESPDEDLRHFSLIALGRLGEKSDTGRVKKFLAAANPYVRRSALIALFRLDPAPGKAQAEQMLGDPFWEIPLAALRILGAAPDGWLYLDDKMKPGDRFEFSLRIASEDAERGSVDLFSDERPASQAGRPGKAAIAAAVALMKHENPVMRYEAGKMLLRYRVNTDYSALIELVIAGEDREFSAYDIINLLSSYWPSVPAEFYPMLRKQSSSRSEALALIRRIDPDQLKLLTKEEKAEFRDLALRAEKVPEPAKPVAPAAAGAASAKHGRYTLAYFYQRGCRDCQQVSSYLEQLEKDFPGLEVRKYNIVPRESVALNEILCDRTGVPARQRQVVPAVFSSRHGLVGEGVTLENLLPMVLASENLPAPWQGVSGEQLAAATENIRERYAGKNVAWVIGAGLVDGINPCAFTVIIFFLSYLAYVGRRKRDLLITGAMFTTGVFATYLLVGLGLLEAVQALKVMPTLARSVYWATGLFALTVGVLSFRDGILCLRGRVKDTALQLPTRIKNLIHGVIRRQTRMGTIVIASLVTGFLVSLLELACTGQVYLPAIVFISKGGVKGTALLVLYNLAFILPLTVIFILAYFGLSSDRLTQFFRKRVAIVKFLLAGLFFGLFALLVVIH